MEKFTVSSETLREKIEEIEYLKKKLKQYETPTVICTSEEWENKKIKAYKMIEEGVNKLFSDDEYYNWMGEMQFTPGQEANLACFIEKGLNYLTDKQNTEWSKRISWEIKYGIESFFLAFSEEDWENNIYPYFTPSKISKLVYDNIIWQLDDDTHWPCILEDVHVSK